MQSNILSCRLCKSKKLDTFLDFGYIAIGNNLASSSRDALNLKKYPLKIKKCIKCNHFQLSYSVDPILLYATNYTYLTGIGNSFVNHIKEYVSWIHSKNKTNKGNFVFEIGSNDGTALNEFKNYGYNVLGIDPANKPVLIAQKKGIDTINGFFDREIIPYILKNYGQPDIITSQNALAHIENLANVFKNAYKLLKLNGLFVFEVGYFKTVLEKNLFDTIYHEHLDYHHAAPLVRFLISLGFDIIELKLVKAQGGSIRFLLKKTGNGKVYSQAKKFLSKEKLSCVNDRVFLKSWVEKIKINNNHFNNLIKKKIKKGFSVIGYGAPTKATLLLHTANLGPDEISFIVEDNALKIDKYLPNGVIIKSFKELKKIKGKILIVILAWNFHEDIINKLKLEKIKCEILVPVPRVKLKKIC